VDFKNKINQQSRDELITGQLFFRQMGAAMELDMSHRSLFAVVGLIALPQKHFLIKTEYQYTIAGWGDLYEDGLIIGIDLTTAKNLKTVARGDNIGSLLTKPVWRI